MAGRSAFCYTYKEPEDIYYELDYMRVHVIFIARLKLILYTKYIWHITYKH